MFFRRKRPKQKTIKIIVSEEIYDAMMALSQTHPLYSLYRRSPNKIAAFLFGTMLRQLAGSLYGHSPKSLTARWEVTTMAQYAEQDKDISDTGHDRTMRRFIDHIFEYTIVNAGEITVLSVTDSIALTLGTDKDTELLSLPVHIDQQLLVQLKWLARVDIFANTMIQRSVVTVRHQQSVYDISMSFIPSDSETIKQRATFRAQLHSEDMPTGWGA